MSYDYKVLQDTVARPLIQRFGIPVTLIRSSDTSVYQKKYDPISKAFIWVDAQGNIFTEEPVSTVQRFTGSGVRTRFREQALESTLIKFGDVRLLAIDIPNPTPGDRIEVEGTIFNVVRGEAIAPGDVEIVYEIHLRI